MLGNFIGVRDQDSYSKSTTSSSSLSPTSATGYSSFINQEEDDNMRKGNRPPPLNLSIVPRPRSLPRLSTTPQPIAKELTPLLTPLPEEAEEPTGPVVRAVRIAVDFMQIVSCLLVILMLAVFLVSYAGAVNSCHGYVSIRSSLHPCIYKHIIYHEAQPSGANSSLSLKALVLIATLVCDVGLGMWSIVNNDKPWSGSAVLLRTLTASVLVGSLVSFLAVDGVFPADYTYWGLPLSQSGAPVLCLVSAILYVYSSLVS